MKAKCIDNSGNEAYLTKGKIYQAQEARYPHLIYIGRDDQEQSGTWWARNFEIIVDDPPPNV